jgi:hypothetical protein
MRRRTLGVISIGLLVLLGGLAAVPAAASQGCATKREFKRVERGMSRERVANIFETDGTLSFRSGQFMNRDYKPCARFAFITVEYKSGEVRKKTGAWA